MLDDSTRHSTTTRRRALRIIVILVGLAALAYGLTQLLGPWRATAGSAPPPNQTSNSDNSDPDERRPDLTNFTVPPDQPKLLHIPAIGVGAPIQRMGLTSNNTVASPSNVHFAGWYVGSAKPGDAGVSVIDGHLSGKHTSGIFAKLSQLTAGDQITVEYGNGSKRRFEVVSGSSVSVGEASARLFAKQADIGQQLNLITCDGAYDRTNRSYERRYIVIARYLD